MQQSPRRRGEPLPHGSYRIVTISIEDESREEQIHAALQEVHNSSLKFKEAVKLKGLLAPRLLRYPIDAARQGTSDTLADVLGHRESIWSAIRYVVRRDAGLDLGDIPNLDSEDLGMALGARNDGTGRWPTGRFRSSTTMWWRRTERDETGKLPSSRDVCRDMRRTVYPTARHSLHYSMSAARGRGPQKRGTATRPSWTFGL
jgi:hypothetical protein